MSTYFLGSCKHWNEAPCVKVQLCPRGGCLLSAFGAQLTGLPPGTAPPTRGSVTTSESLGPELSLVSPCPRQLGRLGAAGGGGLLCLPLHPEHLAHGRG